MLKGRLVGVGIGDYSLDVHKPLKHAVNDVVTLHQLLDDSFEGEPLPNPTETQLRVFLKALKRSMPAGGPLVIVWSGHGFSSPDGLRLPAVDSGADADDGLGVGDIVSSCALSGANQLLFVFDTCFAGEAMSAGDLATQIMRQTQPANQVWVGVVSSCLSLETARDGLFGQRLRKILESGPDMPELKVRWSPHNRYVRGDDLCDAVLKEWGSSAQSPDFQSRGSAWWMFPNPLYRAEAPEQVVEHLLRAARSGAPMEEQSWFTGRTREVNQVVNWVQNRRPGLHVVTGAAGTGKSAIVGRVVSLSNPDERSRLLVDGHTWSHVLPEERSVDAHVHARGLTADMAAGLVAEQLVQRGVLTAQEARRNASELVGQLQRAVEDGARPPVIVVDGLDEARGETFAIAEELLTRLARHAVVIVSTRNLQRGDGGPPLVAAMTPGDPEINLDDPEIQQQGRSDLADYVQLRLGTIDPRMDAAAIAAHLFGQGAAETQNTFLLARLVTDQLSLNPVDTSVQGWQEKVSRSVEGALDADLANILPAPHRRKEEGPTPAVLAWTIMHALTWGYGAGLPEDEWLSITNVEAPEGAAEVMREDITWVLDQLGRHIVQDGEAGVAVYRVAHQSLADHLRPSYRGSPIEPFNPRARMVTQALLRRYRTLLNAQIPAEAAAYLWRYGWRHAADAGFDGLSLLRSLAKENRALSPDVAMAAMLIAAQLAHWGRRADAVAPAEEAVGLYRPLADENPAYLPNLAGALNNLGTCYGDVGQRADAVPPTEEAVGLYRPLADENPAYLPDLAMALNNLGNRYGDVGRQVAAVPPTEEAVGLYRPLADENPAYLPNLAGALNNLGTRYGDVGRQVAAVPPTEEAVRLYRPLADENPAYLPDLAMALNNLGTCYGDVGQRADAVPPTEEAVRLYRPLADENPAYLPDLAMTLNNLGNRYGDAGRQVAAVPPTEEAVRLYRPLADENPAYLPNLAGALNNLGICYRDVGRQVDALAPTEEAVGLYRPLADENPAYHPDLAMTLNNLGNRYRDVGRDSDAIAPTEEAVRLYRPLADENPAYLPNLAGALNNLGICYRGVGRQVDALAPTEEAVRLYRPLADENPAYHPDLAMALNNLGTCYGDVGQRADAVPPTEEAVRLYRPLADENPAYLPNLATALNNLGNRYGDAGRQVAAVPPTEEAVRLYRPLADENPAYHPDLAGALNNLGICYRDVGRDSDAIAPTEEAVRLYRPLADENPAYLPDLATALNNLGNRYRNVGQDSENIWADVLTEVSPENAAFLLLARSSRAQAGDRDAPVWLAKSQGTVTVGADRSLLDIQHSEGRRHRAANQQAFDDAWREYTRAEPPAWLTVDADLVAAARAWVATESYPDERDHLAAHPKLLAPRADDAVNEALIAVGEEEAQRYRDLRQQAQKDGVHAAYRPFLLTRLAEEFVATDQTSQRALLNERRDDLLNETTREVLSTGAASADPETAPAFNRAQALLRLAELDEHSAAFNALDDPARFPELLQALAQRKNPVALQAASYLALAAATTAQLAANAEFHLAVASAIDGDTARASQLLLSALQHFPDADKAWIADLADIARHHPSVLPLIHQLADLSATPPEEPNATD